MSKLWEKRMYSEKVAQPNTGLMRDSGQKDMSESDSAEQTGQESMVLGERMAGMVQQQAPADWIRRNREGTRLFEPCRSPFVKRLVPAF
jgi:hypothetical protein